MQYPLNSCCGLSLRTGAVIIAYLSIMKGIFLIGYGIWLIRSFDKLRWQMNQDPRDVELHGRPCCDEWILDVAGCVAICLGVLVIITSSVLLVGVKKRQPALVAQWPAAIAMLLLCGLGLTVAAIVASASGQRHLLLLLPGLTTIIAAGLDVYGMLVVHSFYRQLLEERKPSPPVPFVG
ncbi:uncharacterized protein LOC126281553 [Schistocerca gregaria]|uniref:uncharacterized protein LOC126281553 n=1 Tax=Schistocerca gregaria TaxID=7010 RepID=UPI00211DD3A5|nr:uncharacterized protein LOC126281553 [Schistocerca gregaria]XP_049836576.1 uncharacterized protein LOC126281553 [Schistocerca gregaria]XP_049836577.1 uncharacterized protein LOC126281553 [Schistocerca gregaria]